MWTRLFTLMFVAASLAACSGGSNDRGSYPSPTSEQLIENIDRFEELGFGKNNSPSAEYEKYKSVWSLEPAEEGLRACQMIVESKRELARNSAAKQTSANRAKGVGFIARPTDVLDTCNLQYRKHKEVMSEIFAPLRPLSARTDKLEGAWSQDGDVCVALEFFGRDQIYLQIYEPWMFSCIGGREQGSSVMLRFDGLNGKYTNEMFATYLSQVSEDQVQLEFTGSSSSMFEWMFEDRKVTLERW